MGGRPFTVLLATFAASIAAAGISPESKDGALLQVSTKGPTAKVVKILEDISTQLSKDADEDEKIDEEMECWCKRNIAGKTKAIEDNTEKKGQLESEIESLRAKSQQLYTEIANLDEEVKKNEEAIETALEMRKKDLADFNAAEASTMTTIKQLTGAEATLATRQKAMLQNDDSNEVVIDAGSTVGMALTHALHKKGKEAYLWELHDREARRIMKDLLKKVATSISSKVDLEESL
jgi:chromosome segregation ATPase